MVRDAARFCEYEPFGEVTLSYTIVALQTGKLPLPIVDIISERYGTFLINEQATLKQQQQQRLSTAMLAPIRHICGAVPRPITKLISLKWKNPTEKFYGLLSTSEYTWMQR